jgi:hypothetical protein
MASVALVCSAAGLVYGSGKLFYGEGEVPQLNQILYVLAFSLLSAFYFYYREAFVEEIELSSHRKNTSYHGWEVAILLALVAIIILFVRGVHLNEVIVLVIALIPFGYLEGRSFVQLRKGSETALAERRFKNKVLLPAFATCLVSFSFGWAVTGPQWAVLCVVIPAILIISLKELAIFRDRPDLKVVEAGGGVDARDHVDRLFPRGTNSIILILASSLFVYSLLYRVWGLPFAKVLIIGTILTFAMGVAEVCKRVTIFYERPQNFIELYSFYEAGANWSSIVFPLLLCFLPLLIDDLPVFPVFLFLSVQYLHWHYWMWGRTDRRLRVINLVLGFSLPAVINVQYLAPLNPVPALFVGMADQLSTLFGIGLAIITIFLTFYQQQLLKFFAALLGRTVGALSDQQSANRLSLFLCVWTCTLGGVWLYGFFGAPLIRQPLIAAKATQTILCLLILFLVTIVLHIYQDREGIRTQSSNPGQPSS